MYDVKELYRKILKENITNSFFCGALVFEVGAFIFTDTPSGLEIYLDNFAAYISGAIMAIGGAGFAYYSADFRKTVSEEKDLVT